MKSELLLHTLPARPARRTWIGPALVALLAGAVLMGIEDKAPAESPPAAASARSAAAGFIDHSVLDRLDLAGEPEPSPMSVGAREE